ncbi:MAG TPA: SpoIIE family protein phosphatase [Planctomycetes bacterium]|nr:SpoIIE family protein phosphatase [Planctomycetota bacterium]
MVKKSKRQIERDEQIYEITSMMAGDFELQEVLDRLAAAAVKITKTNNCSIRLLDDESGDLKMRSTFGLSEEYRNKGPVSKQDPVIKAAFAGEAVVLDDMRVDSRVRYRNATIKEGLVSQLTVAMTFRNKPIGVLRLYSPQPKRFDKDAIALARLVAGQCAIAITNAKLYSQALEGARIAEQMRLGAVIQRRMIPEKAPCMCGLDIAAIYQPCYQVGGDLYDLIQIDDHTIGISIADVIGKGIPAAMMMSMFRGTIRAYADGGYSRHSFDDIINKLNRVAIRECRDGEFITMFMCHIDVETMKMTYCNCGHEPALHIRGGRITELDSGGLVLGVMEQTEHKVETIELRDEDIILLYTDGLIDAMNFDNELWGKERMLEALADSLDRPANQIVRNILGYRRRFVGLARQIDDTSIVAVKIDRNANRPSEINERP